jgi:CRISPR-associated protein (TIGR03984 family)
MKRQIKACQAQVIQTSAFTSGDIRDWLQQHASAHNLRWLLAFADDGVIWGSFSEGVLNLSGDAISIAPPLRAETLQTARLFSENAELLLWRDGDLQWNARLIQDNAAAEETQWREAIDEMHILWGTKAERRNDDFALMSDGSQGLRHIVPIGINGNYDERSRPLRLHVRHYLSEDEETGFVRIVASRLLDLTVEKQS